MATFYLDYENGNDANDGSSWALAWKTITSGATAARIAPGDVIHIAKSPAPYSIGNATWTNLSKTVTLATAQTANIDRCESAWTANGTGDTTVTLTAVGNDAKEGSYCMKLALDASPQTGVMQAYFATGTLDLSSYQQISFWIKNSNAIVANNWTVRLCSDTAGATVVNTFSIPAIPSNNRWLPLTLVADGGGNLGAAIQSISIATGSVAPTASSNILVDNFIACTTSGLSLQSLISKNNAEQGGTEGWYGIQSINGTTVLLDNDTNTKANGGRGYSGTTETVTTYGRETIKAMNTNVVHQTQKSGTLGNNIQYQGGYDTGTGNQTGETFFDGLSGTGTCLAFAGGTNFHTVSHLNGCRYNKFLSISCNNLTIQVLQSANNNAYGVYFENNSYNNTIVTLNNANSNSTYGLMYNASHNISIGTIDNINNNNSHGIYYNASHNDNIGTINNINNNNGYAVYFSLSISDTIGVISTSDNVSGSIYNNLGDLYIGSATIAEATKVAGFTAYADSRFYINSIGGYSAIYCDYGNIVSQAATAGGSGIEWRMNITNAGRDVNYPLTLKIAEVAVAANAQVTATLYFKKSHATNIAAKLVCRGGQIAGVDSDVTATCPSDITRDQLTIQFTPSAAGVVEIEAWAYYVSTSTTDNVIVDDFAVTQA